MREVENIVSTQDGAHVLILCADGGVMYYHNKATTAADASVCAAPCDGKEATAQLAVGGGLHSRTSPSVGSSCGDSTRISISPIRHHNLSLDLTPLALCPISHNLSSRPRCSHRGGCHAAAGGSHFPLNDSVSNPTESPSEPTPLSPIACVKPNKPSTRVRLDHYATVLPFQSRVAATSHHLLHKVMLQVHQMASCQCHDHVDLLRRWGNILSDAC
mmetsp:Transcript_30319/g.41560  ORF Transcript_30319/g.41560 Transcript_30319/m.41560 type:complete len:216 (+) Transcript_30319:546-1193(+)